MKLVFTTSVAILLCIIGFDVSAQTKTKRNTKKLSPATETVSAAGDSIQKAMQIQPAAVLTLSLMAEAKKLADASQDALVAYQDTVLIVKMPSLTDARKDSVKYITKSLQALLNSFGDTERLQLSKNLTGLEKTIQAQPLSKAKEAAQAFIKTAKEDFATFTETFSDSSNTLRDSIYSYAEAQLGSQTDAVQDAKDSTAAASEAVSAPDRTSSFTVGTTYSSRSVWQGIDQNNGNAVLTPALIYKHWTGISASLSSSRLDGQAIPWGQTTLGLGYDLDVTDHFAIAFGVDHYIYADSSLPKSTIKNDVSLTLTYETSILTPALNATYGFAKPKGNPSLSLQASHSFDVEKFLGGSLSVEPTVLGNAGTLNGITFKSQKVKLANGKTVIRKVALANSKFNITDYDLSLPVTYSIGIFTLVPEPVYAIPVNDAKTDSNGLFYFSLGLYVSF
jgi:hypothetical protein